MKDAPITVLGFDPGVERLGWGVVTGTSFHERECLSYGLVTTRKKNSLEDRLLEISNDVEYLLDKYHPTVVYAERLFFAQNVTTAFMVSEVRGIIKVLTKKREIAYAEIHPMTLKKRITGTGRATKEQIRFMVEKIFTFEERPYPDDVTDGIAIAYCGFLERCSKYRV